MSLLIQLLALDDTCSERPPKTARSHRPWFPSEHLVTQRENLLCTTDLLLLISWYNRKQSRSRPCPQGADCAARETHRRPENTVCFMVQKKKKSMEKTQVKKNGEQQRVVVAILNTMVRFR